MILDDDDKFPHVHGLCDRAVVRDELKLVLKEVKTRKAVGLDSIYPEFLMSATAKELECWTASFYLLLGSEYPAQLKTDKNRKWLFMYLVKRAVDM